MAQSFDEWANNPANRGKSVSEFLNQNQTSTQTTPTQTTAPAQTASATTTASTTTTTTTPAQTTYYSPATDSVAPFSNETTISGAGTSKLTNQQIQELDALAYKSQLTDIDKKNLAYAKTLGYVSPTDRGKTDLSIPEEKGAIDTSKIEDVDINKYLPDTKTKTTSEIDSPAWVQEFLNQNQKMLDTYTRQINEVTTALKDAYARERDYAENKARGLAENSSEYRAAIVKQYYDLYDVNGNYGILQNVNKQMADLSAAIAGQTVTGDMSSAYHKQMASLSALANMAQGNLNNAIKLAGSYIDQEIAGYTDSINYYNKLLSLSDSGLLSLSKEEKDNFYNSIDWYRDLIQKDQDKKDENENILKTTSANAMNRAINNGYDMYSDDPIKQRQILNQAIADQNAVDSLSIKYKTAGILPSDTIEEAYNKLLGTDEYRLEMASGIGSDSDVVTRAMKLMKDNPELDFWNALSIADSTIKEEKAELDGKKTGTSSDKSQVFIEQAKNIVDDLNSISGVNLISGTFTKNNNPIDTIIAAFMKGDEDTLHKISRAVDFLSLDNLTELKNNGATFGALSDNELRAIGSAATSLKDAFLYKTDKNGNKVLTSIDMSEKQVKTELNRIINTLSKLFYTDQTDSTTSK